MNKKRGRLDDKKGKRCAEARARAVTRSYLKYKGRVHLLVLIPYRTNTYALCTDAAAERPREANFTSGKSALLGALPARSDF